MTITTRCDAHQWSALVLIAATACADSAQSDHAPTLQFAQVEWLLDHGATLNSIAFGTSTTGIAVGDVGAILVTRDAGSSWAHVESGSGRALRAVAFADSAHAVAVGAGGVLLRSEDTGVSWARVPVSSAVELRGVAFGSAGVGVAVGDSGAIQHTGDGGRTWSSAARATNSVLHAVRFTTPGSAVAVGDGGTILLSVDGGQHWTVGFRRVFVRSDAALQVARYLGGAWRLAAACAIVPRPLRDRVYDLVAQHRHRLTSRQAECFVPGPDVRHRFL